MQVNGWTLFLILGLVIILIAMLKKNYENYGQDASIRASSGGLAGPSGIYGYDPIKHFQNQIDKMRLVMMNDRPNLMSSPTKDIGSCSSCMTTEEFGY